MGRNVDVSNSELPGRLQHLREERCLTQADLAEQAGLSYRTVLDLERGRRERVQVKTLMLLAKALDISYEDLRGDAVENEAAEPVSESPTVGPPLWRRPWFVVVLTFGAAIVIAALIVLGNVSAARFELSRENTVLTARDDWLGVKCWDREFDAPINFCETSPWSDDVVLVGLYGDTVEGGCVKALDRETGITLWGVAPDIDAIARAFGEEIAFSANYSCTGVAMPDLDGDGIRELVIRFCHGLWYPTALCFVDADGKITSQYSHKGHLYDMLAADIDHDGKDELVVVGTNNTKGYQGATVFILDEDHRSGASVDAEAAPTSVEPDSALVRVVFPQFPESYMHQMGAQRLEADRIRPYQSSNGSVRLIVTVGRAPNYMLTIDMDSSLIPLSCGISDGFLSRIDLEHWPDSLIVDTGPPDEAWRMEWLDTHLRFEAGHWPPDLPASP